MARVKLTEHKAKSLFYDFLGYSYSGVSVKTGEKIPVLSSKKTYVVKVDQGVKKRMKQGLVKLEIRNEKLEMAMKDLEKKGYEHFIIEEMLPHESDEEKYIAIERTREGMTVTYSKKGGIDIEEHRDEVKQIILNDRLEMRNGKVERELSLPMGFISKLREFCDKYYVSFLEINPIVVQNGKIHLLDLAVEVDSTAQFFVASPKTSSSIRGGLARRSLGEGGWNEDDIVSEKHKSPEEMSVAILNKKSQAALSLTLLNPNGTIWVLLSGGGASITLADEVHNLGFGKELGNYGEYSGNPNAEETYLYTCEVSALLLKSNKRRLILIIGGGVANFTDIRITFKGIIKALEKFKNKMKKRNIKIFVRRGGPHEKEGLEAMEEWLKQNKMYGLVSGPNLPLNEIVRSALKELKS